MSDKIKHRQQRLPKHGKKVVPLRAGGDKRIVPLRVRDEDDDRFDPRHWDQRDQERW